MAVTFDAVGPSSSGYTLSGSAASGSWSHTVGASANFLIAWIAFDDTGTGTVTCTAGGSAMTAFAANPVDNNSLGYSYAFWLADPPTGSVTIAWTTTETGQDYTTGGSLSFTGASGSLGTPDVVSSNTGSSLTLTVTGVSSTSMVAGFGGFGDTLSGTTVTGTSRFEAIGGGEGGATNANSAGATNTGTGSVSVGWSGLPDTDTNAGLAVEILASATSTPAAPGRQLPSFVSVQAFRAGPAVRSW